MIQEPGPVFIVNGDDTRPGSDFSTLGNAAKAALVLSRNTARPFEEWELRKMSGELEDHERALTPEDDGKHFFLTLRVGAGGDFEGAFTISFDFEGAFTISFDGTIELTQ